MSITTPPAVDPTEQDFQPLFPDQDEDTILNRMVGWANEGLDPVQDADQWVDTREGSHWYMSVFPCVRELARIYDLMGTEVPMSGFVLWSWGTYLDDLAAVYQVERLAAQPAHGLLQFTGPVGAEIDAGVTVTAQPATADDPAQDFTVLEAGAIPGAGTLLLPIQAVEAGTAGNVAPNVITIPSTPLPDGVTFTNPDRTTDGADPETDDALRTRVLQATAGKGPGTVNDYIRWVTSYAAVGSVKVVPLWNGPGTVMIVAADSEGNPISSALVTGLQNFLDPIAGQGAGAAPIGAAVTVDTSTLMNLTLAATIVWANGYSWDGAGSTIAAGPAIEAAIATYLLTIQPGDDIIYAKVSGIIATAAGVANLTALTLDPGTGPVSADIPVPLNPPQQPVVQTYTIT